MAFAGSVRSGHKVTKGIYYLSHDTDEWQFLSVSWHFFEHYYGFCVMTQKKPAIHLCRDITKAGLQYI